MAETLQWSQAPNPNPDPNPNPNPNPNQGHLVVIMEKMCFDVTCWLLLFLTIMLGFVSAFLVLYAEPMRSYVTLADDATPTPSPPAPPATPSPKASAVTNFGQYQHSFLSLWRLTLGDVDYLELERSHSRVQVRVRVRMRVRRPGLVLLHSLREP